MPSNASVGLLHFAWAFCKNLDSCTRSAGLTRLTFFLQKSLKRHWKEPFCCLRRASSLQTRKKPQERPGEKASTIMIHFALPIVPFFPCSTLPLKYGCRLRRRLQRCSIVLDLSGNIGKTIRKAPFSSIYFSLLFRSET